MYGAIRAALQKEKGEFMTIGELIVSVDSLVSNQVGEAQKYRWINDIEGRVLCEIHRENPKEIKELTYDSDELCVPAPYSGMYSLYLVAMIEFFSGNYDEYTTAIAEFERVFTAYAKYYIRSRR